MIQRSVCVKPRPEFTHKRNLILALLISIPIGWAVVIWLIWWVCRVVFG